MAESFATPAHPDPIRARLVATMTDRVARAGVRGATFRDIGQACDVNIATIANLFDNKEGLVSECFARVVEDEGVYLAGLLEETRALAAEPRLLADLLWLLIEDAAGARWSQTAVLLELLLAAPGNATYRAHARRWLVTRRDFFRALAEIAGVDRERLDTLGLQLLTETTFAVSCFGSAAYRMAARLSLRWLAARLTDGRAPAEVEAGMLTLASTFYVSEPDPDSPDASRGRSRQNRAAVSRAKMIDAAAAIIEHDGLAAVTNRAVAERAGVSLALTTYHFDTVNELAFAGAVRVFQKVCRGLGGDASQPVDRTRDIHSRDDLAAYGRELAMTPAAGGARNINRGMVEISLAAARAPDFDGLGLGMRRQRGVITYAMMRRLDEAAPSRAAAAVFAMWGAALNLTSDAVGADSLYDVAALAELATGTIAAI